MPESAWCLWCQPETNQAHSSLNESQFYPDHHAVSFPLTQVLQLSSTILLAMSPPNKLQSVILIRSTSFFGFMAIWSLCAGSYANNRFCQKKKHLPCYNVLKIAQVLLKGSRLLCDCQSPRYPSTFALKIWFNTLLFDCLLFCLLLVFVPPVPQTLLASLSLSLTEPILLSCPLFLLSVQFQTLQTDTMFYFYVVWLFWPGLCTIWLRAHLDQGKICLAMTLLNILLLFSIYKLMDFNKYLKVLVHRNYYSYLCSNYPMVVQCDLSPHWLFLTQLFIFDNFLAF